MENPIKMDDLGVPLFLETPKCFLFRFSKMKPHTFEGSGFNWVAFLFWLLFLSDEISPCQGQIGVIFLAWPFSWRKASISFYWSHLFRCDYQVRICFLSLPIQGSSNHPKSFQNLNLDVSQFSVLQPQRKQPRTRHFPTFFPRASRSRIRSPQIPARCFWSTAPRHFLGKFVAKRHAAQPE